MKTRTKVLLLLSGASVLVAGSVLGTLAFLTDSEQAINTFTVGNVSIDLAETDVDNDGNPLENAYQLVPGQSYVKDPTVTVEAGSEAAYIRMILTVHNWTLAEELIFDTDAMPFAALGGLDPDKWVYEDMTVNETDDTAAIEYRYYRTEDGVTDAGAVEDVVLDPLFTTLIIPGTLTGENMQALADGGFKMVVEGHAIQAAGFADADAAWAAFDEQNAE